MVKGRVIADNPLNGTIQTVVVKLPHNLGPNPRDWSMKYLSPNYNLIRFVLCWAPRGFMIWKYYILDKTCKVRIWRIA